MVRRHFFDVSFASSLRIKECEIRRKKSLSSFFIIRRRLVRTSFYTERDTEASRERLVFLLIFGAHRGVIFLGVIALPLTLSVLVMIRYLKSLLGTLCDNTILPFFTITDSSFRSHQTDLITFSQPLTSIFLNFSSRRRARRVRRSVLTAQVPHRFVIALRAGGINALYELM